MTWDNAQHAVQSEGQVPGSEPGAGRGPGCTSLVWPTCLLDLLIRETPGMVVRDGVGGFCLWLTFEKTTQWRRQTTGFGVGLYLRFTFVVVFLSWWQNIHNLKIAILIIFKCTIQCTLMTFIMSTILSSFPHFFPLSHTETPCPLSNNSSLPPSHQPQ